MTRVISNILLTLLGVFVGLLVDNMFGYPHNPWAARGLFLQLLGGGFGFWWSYTGRLARMFRKVG